MTDYSTSIQRAREAGWQFDASVTADIDLMLDEGP